MVSDKPKKVNRNRGYYRHQRKRAIKRKLHILKNIKNYEDDYVTAKTVGQLNKGKVHCSCPLCRFEKFYNIEHYKYKSMEKENKKEINNYLFNNQE